MFCSECGTKNQDGAKFCENCGATLEIEETSSKKVEETVAETKKEAKKETKTETKKEEVKKKKSSKKQKALTILCIILIVVLFGGYKILERKTNPATIADNYIKAIENKEYSTLYKLSEFSGDTTFISEEAFKLVFDETFKETPFTNYTINKTPTYTNSDLQAIVSVSFAGTSTGASDTTVTLTKEKGKKFLFFDNWKIKDTSHLLGYEVIKDFEIKAPKGSKIKYDGIEISDKYLVTDNGDKKEALTVDVYKLPQVFEKDAVKIETVTPYGITTSTDARINSYASPYSIEIDIADFSDELKDSIKKNLQAQISELENGLMSGKSFNEQKHLFSSVMDLQTLEKTYGNASKRILEKSYKESDFNITEFSLESLKYADNYTLRAQINLKYTYKRTNKTTGEVDDRQDSWYLTVNLNYENGEFKIYNLSDVYDGYWW